MKFCTYLPTILASFALVGCVGNDDDSGGLGGGGSAGGGGGGVGPLRGCEALDSLDLGADNLSIVDLDGAALSPIVTDVFDRYTAIVTPSGRRIHIVAQAGVNDAKIRRARSIMAMHLDDLPGSSAGANKADVANSISGTCGTIAMFANESQYDLANASVSTFDADFGSAYVPLFGNRVIVEGTPEYLQSSPAYDQTFGATAVLAYRHGLRAQRPGWSNQLQLASDNALADGTFSPAGPEPYLSLDEAFLGVVMESHAGVWGHDPSGDGSAQNGVYAFGDRPSMAAGDASTLQLLENFFTPQHTFPAELSAGFSGTFDMLLRDSVGYTNRAQYLSEIRLKGSNSAELFGSTAGDRLFGNAGNNNLNGRSGDDFLDGGAGIDTAVYPAPRAEFTITDNGDGTRTVAHNVVPGFGTDTLVAIEVLFFTDQTINL